MPFRECINCYWMACTVRRKCFGDEGFANEPELLDVLQIEAIHIAALHQKTHQKPTRKKNFYAPAPLSGYARRKRKNGTYGENYNFLHTGNWHGVIRFFKNH